MGGKLWDPARIFLGEPSLTTRKLQAWKYLDLEDIEPLNHLLKRFGELSGLNVQPQKSIVIPLNAAWEQGRCHGYPVLAKGGVISILGYQLGTHDTTQHNWDVRVQNIKKRLQVATRVTNSVKQRVMLFNACCPQYYSLGCIFQYRSRYCGNWNSSKSDLSGKGLQEKL
ncbi:LOW QUALITY PROTEIN: RxLR effector candidate protein [Phytophthora palmivora]|uniref:RxLR effector candidate protein n=1 Tax=Phytophthora palmivora TaxID=4796 RepID=A0A2P4YKP1_9STRA|nr:LOW QUALITY PROTEIN: RxLR effector candidate protein [Phytophthora palmivora]